MVFSFRIPTTSDSEDYREEVKAREAIANSGGSFAMRQDSEEEGVIATGSRWITVGGGGQMR